MGDQNFLKDRAKTFVKNEQKSMFIQHTNNLNDVINEKDPEVKVDESPLTIK